MSERRVRDGDATHDEGVVAVGLMSGTSLDGVAAAAVRFAGGGALPVRYELLAFRSTPYTTAQRERLAHANAGATPAEYCRLNVDLGAWLSDAALAVVGDARLAPRDVGVVASHGQTVWHEPGHSTWQTGDAATIAERTGIATVSDFRARDVAAGGQGAPLVPIADALLFSDARHARLLQNLGGIGNVSVVPAGGALDGVRAFDTGPGAGVVDLVTRLLRPDLPYDVDGRLALAGTPAATVVDELLAAPYFASPPPKSTGRELFSPAYAEALVRRCREAGHARDEDAVATAVELTARSVADAYRRFVHETVGEVVLSGGGARNPAIVAAIRRAVGAPGLAAPVRRFDELFFDGEAKEAVAFALLGYLHLRGLPGNVPSATGARARRVLGALTPGGAAPGGA